MDQEHLEAWTKIKKHLEEHQRNLLGFQGFRQQADADAVDDVVDDIDECIQKVEEIFICSHGI